MQTWKFDKSTLNRMDIVYIYQEFSRSAVSDSMRPHGLQHSRPPCPSPTPRVCSNSCPSSQWCHPTISPSVVPFSSHLQSFPASGSFPTTQFFASGGQRTGVSASASVLPINIQDWFPLGWTGWISLQSSKGHQFEAMQTNWFITHKSQGYFCWKWILNDETLTFLVEKSPRKF